MDLIKRSDEEVKQLGQNKGYRYATTLNALADMQNSPAYAVRRQILLDAELSIVSLEDESKIQSARIAELEAQLARFEVVGSVSWLGGVQVVKYTKSLEAGTKLFALKDEK